MNKILVDSSVWIGFFKGLEEAKQLFQLIDSNMICTNDLIMTELIPSLIHKKESELVDLLNSIEKTKMDIDWNGINQLQIQNLRNGLNRVGVPDLIIAQNAIQNNLVLYSFDKHFELMKKGMGLKTFSGK
jgi:predicted nucleic acid-binding protein